jgi:sulfoxide reductase heme-binding subunit YedZ
MSHRRRGARRLVHNGAIAVGVLALGAIVAVAFPEEVRVKISAATAYVAMACVGGSLAIGPLNLLRGRPNPVSSDLRRDLGIWGALTGLVHVGVGLTVHFRGRMHLYFLPLPESQSPLPVRVDAFGLANHAGVLAALVLLLLLALSNDRALARLGARRWKRWQRLNYLGAVAILGHGVLYQLLERRRFSMVILFAFLAGVAMAMQGLGVRRVRRG